MHGHHLPLSFHMVSCGTLSTEVWNQYHPQLGTIMVILAVSLLWDRLTSRQSPSIKTTSGEIPVTWYRHSHCISSQRQMQDVAEEMRSALLIYYCVPLGCKSQDHCERTTTGIGASCTLKWMEKKKCWGPHIKRSCYIVETPSERKLSNVAEKIAKWDLREENVQDKLIIP